MKTFISSLILFLSSQVASAAIMDFNSTAYTGWYQSSITSGDYQFTKNGGWMSVNPYSSTNPVGANNSTPDLDMGYGIFTLSRLDSQVFNLNSLDVGLSWYNFNTVDTLTITGHIHGGGTVTSTLSLGHSYENFTLDFTNLDAITFSGHALDNGYAVIDNLDINPYAPGQSLTQQPATPVSPPANVPEPSILSLFVFGLIGLKLARSKSTSTCT